MSTKKRKPSGPRWREFMQAANARIVKRGGYAARDAAAQIAVEIVDAGEASSFLKAVRRGRGTQQQNLRYQLLREVERLAGDKVKRRRPDSNTPDSVALKKAVTMELAGLCVPVPSDTFRFEPLK